MPTPDNFATALFNNYMRDIPRAALTSAAEDIAHNRAIAAILTDAHAAIARLGAPRFYMAPGYDYTDALELLRDITPRFDLPTTALAEVHAADREAA